MSIIATLIGMAALLMLTYVHASAASSEMYPFYMTNNHMVFKRNTDSLVTFEDIIDLNTDTDVLVISQYQDETILGVYDPTMVMAFQNLHTVPGFTRYFSLSDYENKTKSGILISDSYQHDLEKKKLITTPYIDDVMYFTDTQSSFSTDKNVNSVVNLASLEHFGDTVYIDFAHKDFAKNIIGQLKDFGYREQKGISTGYIEALIFHPKNEVSLVMFFGLLMCYVIVAFVAFWNFYNQRKYIILHFLHGGTLETTSKNFLGGFFVLSFIGTIPILLLVEVLKKIGFILVSNISILGFIVVHLMLVFSIYILAFNHVFNLTKENKRGDKYVS